MQYFASPLSKAPDGELFSLPNAPLPAFDARSAFAISVGTALYESCLIQIQCAGFAGPIVLSAELV
ncbi:hypothetical protein CPC08DRAFT_499090 [Agrocybe pediades]|nr:hypothetical protein CPC08DRAFT_499090 [Agrocybe pediades]